MPANPLEILSFSSSAPKPQVQQLENDLLKEKKLHLWVLREDLVHPEIPGNKWRKLKYNLVAAAEQKKETLLTFGGAYSNHLAAVAAAGKTLGFRTIGLVRGEETNPLNPTLQRATVNGMELQYLNRETYRQKQKAWFLEDLNTKFKDPYIIPEGGTNCFAVKGCAEIIAEIPKPFDYLCCSAGTGGTATGLLSGLVSGKKLIAFSALKGDFLQDEIDQLTWQCQNKKYKNWQLQTDYHFGGYAKFNRELIDFIKDFENQFQIPLEPVYTGKMFYGLFDLIRKDYFKAGETIVAIHTGGLQGRVGFEQKFGLTL